MIKSEHDIGNYRDITQDKFQYIDYIVCSHRMGSYNGDTMGMYIV